MRLLSIVFLAVFGPGLSPAGAEQAPLAPVMELVRADEWDAARRAARPIGPVALDIVEWRRLRAGEGTPGDHADFLRRNGDWPGLARLRRRGEEALDATTPARTVRALFGDAPPQTGNGAYHLSRALRHAGRTAEADDVLVRAWRRIPMSREEEETLLRNHGALLRPYNRERLDMLLWRGESARAEAFLPEVGTDLRRLARARIGLRRGVRGVDALIAQVPRDLADDPGLAYERFLWRKRKGRFDSALDLIQAQSSSAGRLGRPALWAGHRRSMARQLMRDGRAGAAYRLASNHHLSEGAAFADLEWLSGYIALRGLGDPGTALDHFRRFRAAVSTPISLGRAGYWQGLAQEALGDPQAARAAFARAAEHQTSFYGLLAAERIGRGMDPALAAAAPVRPDWRKAGFAESSVLRAALLFHAAGELSLAEQFLAHLAEGLDRDGFEHLADLAERLDEPHLAVRIAKQAARQGHVLMDLYYPRHPLAAERLPVAPELALAIARRESEFDPGVVSPAGARGLMQLMPRTARSVARELGLAYRPGALLGDWRYNARLGAGYLDRLIGEFGQSYVLVAAAYNAGPGRVRRWIERHGDPRAPGVDPVDWIERIPFRETRNYVMRVMESLPVYRARLRGRAGPITLSRELRATPQGL